MSKDTRPVCSAHGSHLHAVVAGRGSSEPEAELDGVDGYSDGRSDKPQVLSGCTVVHIHTVIRGLTVVGAGLNGGAAVALVSSPGRGPVLASQTNQGEPFFRLFLFGQSISLYLLQMTRP